MKILSSQVQLTGKQSESSVTMDIQSLSVRELSQGTRVGKGDGVEGDGGVRNDSGSVTLSLTNRVAEEQRIATQSTVQAVVVEDGETVIKHHQSLQIAKHVAEQSTEMELTVREVIPSAGGQITGTETESFQIGVGIRVEVLSLFTQNSSEALTFEALGQVTTEDGRSIDFMLALDYQRSISSEQVNQFVGNRNLIDPLMINLNGGAVEFTDLTFEFDLNSDGNIDGKSERIAQTASGSGFLVFDKNHNGEIDDGSEMFGPQSGQGFAELSAYDDDGNGWIDENDAIYAELGVMSFSAEGRVMESLMDAGVGAIFLGSVASNYELNTGSGTFVGEISQSGVALAEDGRTLLMQEVHLQDFSAGEARNVINSGIQLDAIQLNAGTLGIESPLGFFQFEDPLISARNEQTQVRIGSASAFNIEMQAEMSFSLAITVASAGQQTFDRAAVALELSEWVASAMVDFKPRGAESNSLLQQSNVFFEIAQVKSPVFDQALTELDLEALKLEASLSTMRSMVESLREMRVQMAQSQTQSQPQLSVYQSINRFK
ncbi:MAG: hypothetical protein JKY50_19500 [Oleispira sp.]|nr:hypothetical protein [Oleispira sp.]MBL4880603.1 hypothetical protein [Oleispira sp.]